MNTKILGDRGESFACEFLVREGYVILQTKYRTKIGEIDIIAKEGDMLAFIEVKTRSDDGWDAFEAVYPAKQRKIYRVAEQYLLETYHSVDINGRFDVLAVYAGDDGSLRGDLLRNAFSR